MKNMLGAWIYTCPDSVRCRFIHGWFKLTTIHSDCVESLEIKSNAPSPYLSLSQQTKLSSRYEVEEVELATDALTSHTSHKY